MILFMTVTLFVILCVAMVLWAELTSTHDAEFEEYDRTFWANAQEEEARAWNADLQESLEALKLLERIVHTDYQKMMEKVDQICKQAQVTWVQDVDTMLGGIEELMHPVARAQFERRKAERLLTQVKERFHYLPINSQFNITNSLYDREVPIFQLEN